MALRYWGDEETGPERFASLLTPDGTGIRTLRAATADLGWTALALSGDVATVDGQLRRGRPLIALLQVGRDRYHYVTVVGRVGGRIVFHDPAVSPYRSLPEEEFLEAWSGGRYWAMLVLPGPGARRAGDEGVARPGSRTAASGDAPGASVSPARCATAVDRGIRLARRGALAEAEGVLSAATRSCPGAPRPLRELSALRLRQGRPAEAARLARAALDRGPPDRGLERPSRSRRRHRGRPALGVWPGAGAGSARDIPARGHDLLTDGRIVGPLFGRRIAYSGLETVRWLPVAPLDVGLAAFLDLAASGARPRRHRRARLPQ